MNDDTPNIEQPEKDEGTGGSLPSESQAAPRRLRRSSRDRVLLGVAGGLGQYFGIDPVIVRIGFALSIFFGGLGALAYLLLAIFVPTDGDPDRAQRIGARLQAMGLWRALGLVAVAALALVGLVALAGAGSFAVGLGWSVPVAIVIFVLLLAIFVPTDGDPDRAQGIGGRLQAMGFWRAVGLVAVAALALVGLVALAGAASFAVAFGWGVPVAIAIILVGGLLALAGLRGGARWLIPPAVAIAIGAGVAEAADLDFRGGIGKREYQPLSAKSIPADGYRLGIGRLVVDLRHINWNRERVVRLKVDLGAGQADVFVPKRVCVAGQTHTGVGESEVVGEKSDGFDVNQIAGSGSTAVPRLQIDADVDVGQLRVINSDTASVDTALAPSAPPTTPAPPTPPASRPPIAARLAPAPASPAPAAPAPPEAPAPPRPSDNPGYGPGHFHEATAPLRAAEARSCGTG
jgi:phage shock protein PspC (stress-responsive transcriptional regulator)